MHELGIATDLFEIVRTQARKNNFEKVTRIHIKIGQASGIEEGFLRHSLNDHLLPGTLAEGCELALEMEAVKLKCSRCQTELTDGDKCPQCRSTDLDILSGKKVYVASIEGQ